ncbi:MAG: galactose oxidase, partial [Actinomyces sp.]|nr:galactose oxidase [Actinomyces sp.]
EISTGNSEPSELVLFPLYFTKSVNNDAMKATALSTQAGAAPVAPWQFVGSASERSNYQQAIADSGQLVFVGGSEHSMFGFERTGFQRVSGSITKGVGGDLQAIATNGDVAYGGCHCGEYVYQDAYGWSNIGDGWSEADKIQWIGAWDARTGKQLEEFTAFRLESPGAGAWSLFMADDGALWAGGDFTGSRTSASRAQWNGGWVRFPPRDTNAPSTPSALRTTASTAADVTLGWDGVAGASAYQVLRDDRTVATTSSTSVSVPRGGEERFFVRAVDAEGNISASTPVHVPPPAGEVDPENPVLIEATSTWSYSYGGGAPGAGWTGTTFDDSHWSSGVAPIGYGAPGLGTVLVPPAERPVTTFFRHDFSIEDPDAVDHLTLSFVADDGAVVHVNGQEVGRARMSEGAVTPETRANAAVTTAVASATPVTVDVPASLLVAGENVVAAETHLNYRSSPNMSFSATLTAVPGDGHPDPDPDPDPAEPVEVVPLGGRWSYRNETAAPDTAWKADADLAGWLTGVAPLGWGHPGVVTSLDKPTAERAASLYFVTDIDIGDVSETSVLDLVTRADDGVVVYVNGQEVTRHRMTEGTVSHSTWANAAVNTAAALATPVTVEVPGVALRDGMNRIAVETHLNYRSTPSATFDLSATLVR